jgi:hypothetical protein
MLFWYNYKEIEITHLGDLQKKLDIIKNEQYFEIALTSGQNGPILIILKSGDKSFVLYMETLGDVGCHSVNPESQSSEMIGFYLSNGQLDHYPLQWLVSIESALECIIMFFYDKKRPNCIYWI